MASRERRKRGDRADRMLRHWTLLTEEDAQAVALGEMELATVLRNRYGGTDEELQREIAEFERRLDPPDGEEHRPEPYHR